MILNIDRGVNEVGVYTVLYGPTEDTSIASYKKNFSGRWSTELIWDLRYLKSLDELITIHLPTLKGSLLTIKHPHIICNEDLKRLWFARMKYRKNDVELVERGTRIFEDGGVEYHAKKIYEFNQSR